MAFWHTIRLLNLYMSDFFVPLQPILAAIDKEMPKKVG